MRLLDLVEQEDRVGPAADRLGQLTAFLEPDVPGRSADEPCDGVLLHVLRHVEPHERALVVEEEFREGLRQQGLADACRTEEQERAERPVGVLHAGARAAHRVRHGRDRLLLADDALVQVLLHA